MRSEHLSAGKRALHCGASLAIIASLAACSNDAIRFEEALVTNATMTSNQHAIIHGKAAPQPYPSTAAGGNGIKVAGASVPSTPPIVAGTMAASSVQPSVATQVVSRSALPPVASDTSSKLNAPAATAKAGSVLSERPPVDAAARSEQAKANVAAVTLPRPVAPAPGVQTRTVNGTEVPILQPEPARSLTTASVPAAKNAEAAPASEPALPKRQAAQGWASVDGRGSRVTVREGETLYNLSRRYGVPVKAIKEANGIADASSVQAGQQVVIPRYAYGEDAPVSAPDSNPETKAARASQGYQGQPRGAVATPTPRAPYTVASTTKVDRTVTGSVPKSTARTSRAADTRPSAEKTAEPVASAGVASSFRWPVEGRITSRFGERTRVGTNDGIDIAVPKGTPVRAAREGTVIYSGAELEDFGRLILISHADGWVSAYAHNDATLVKRGQKVASGDVIAKAGSTGNTNVPKLHFELRRNSSPVNPLDYLKR